ncbi:MAG: nuclear transport factor 2 family protein [Pseudomonadota bacterium]
MKYLAAAAMLLMSPAYAQGAEPSATVSIAEDYLAAYSTFDTAVMAPFLAEDMVFYDPTSANQSADGGPFMFEGKDEVLKGLGDYAGQYQSLSVDYDVERQYESEGVVVFVATLTWTVISPGGESASGSAPIVTAVTVKDSKVIKHTDYYDYKGNAVSFDTAP